MPMRRFHKSTIKDVAAQAGVSTTTVSVFVSGREDVCSPETGERIRRAIAALHYVPSSLTRGLRQNASTTLGVGLPYPQEPGLRYGMSFFGQLWQGLIAQTSAEDYALLHYPASVRDGRRWEPFLDGRVDGLLLHEHEHDRAARLAQAGMPTVLLAASVDLPDGCGAVWADEAQTADAALSHLWGLGHRRIAHVAGPVGTRGPAQAPPDVDTWLWQDDVAIARLEGYTAWMRARGAFDPAVVAYAQAWSAPQAADILAAWLARDRPPTAVFCANDAQALDVIAAARARGLRVPEDLSVVGADDSLAARESDPPLTSVHVAIEDVGREAVRALLRLMEGAPVEDGRITLSRSQLVTRRSTAPVPTG